MQEKDKKEVLDYQGRKIRGLAIITKGDNPEPLQRNCYLIPSQSGQGKYLVCKKMYHWTCECLDYKQREIECKHIHAIKFWLTLKNRITKEITEIPSIQENLCAYCNSDKIVRNGKFKDKQRFMCRSCNRTFVAERDFKKYKGNGKIISLVLDLYFKGVSLRKIQDHLFQFYNFEIDHSTIYRWIRRFNKVISEYVAKYKPEVSSMWHTDEQMVKVNGEWMWSWNVLDHDTRFLITNLLTETREIGDARKVFRLAKEVTQIKPQAIVTDGLQGYRGAIKKEFPTKTFTEHIRLESIRAKKNNNLVERFHGSFRERDKVMRGFKKPETTQELLLGYRNYYNFLRPHMGLNGLTPAQRCGIELELKQNRWLDILKKSMASTVVQQR